MNEISLKNYYKICKMSIERIVNLYAEFWSQLSEDIPGILINSKIRNFFNIILKKHFK